MKYEYLDPQADNYAILHECFIFISEKVENKNKLRRICHQKEWIKVPNEILAM